MNDFKNIIRSKTNFNYEDFLHKMHIEETQLTNGWLLNGKPNDDYILESDNSFEICDYSQNSQSIVGLEEIINQRKSTYISEMGCSWSKEELLDVLNTSLGIKSSFKIIKNHKRNLRKYPSGGSMYPIDSYVFAFNISGIERGVYKYVPNGFGLQRILLGLNIEEYSNIFPALKYYDNPDIIKNTSCLVVFISDYEEIFRKYGALSRKLALLECGHMCENMQLIISNIEKKSLPLCGIFSDTIREMATLSRSQFPEYGLLLG